ncbi:MAG: UDP-N-acetylmuramate dehydrogenase [Halieaceae bacterium]|jgi:UDP-N-acetylmuramate dehydrogenase|nr:UDP-N-acetylmuramate dehydrogenase [Halieaceae bacterium]
MLNPQNQPLARYNALGLHSEAEHFLSISSNEEFVPALAWAAERQLEVNVLGAGSNVLLYPKINGLTLHIATTGIEILDDDGRFITLRVAAGELWHPFVAWCTRMGYHGLANLAWIPGTVGAAPVQNIGAYGVEVEQVICGVQVVERSTGKTRNLSHADCGFGYRDSVFKRPAGKDFLITAVDFRLDRNAELVADYPSLREALGDRPVTQQTIFETVINVRKARLPDPSVTPNVGSFFKNPSVSWNSAEIFSMRWPEMPQFPAENGMIKLAAGWMIAHLGWRGVDRDEVGVHPDHALVLVNRGATNVSHFLSLADEIAESVEATFEIRLEREPMLIGDKGVL